MCSSSFTDQMLKEHRNHLLQVPGFENKTKQKERKMDILVTMERLKKTIFLGHWKQAKHRKYFLLPFHFPLCSPQNINSSVILWKAALSLLDLERKCNCFFHIPVMMRATKIHFLHKAICHSLKLLLPELRSFLQKWHLLRTCTERKSDK